MVVFDFLFVCLFFGTLERGCFCVLANPKQTINSILPDSREADKDNSSIKVHTIDACGVPPLHLGVGQE